ncbi:MAG: TetR/AcrR family transcriptional regulator [Clostridia bacterium]|nr:TetR/AcrR family transcriptional regulator [Clostridia bacterium]
MPPKARIARENILAAAYAIAREQGAEQINARTISRRLGCSTQPVLYHYDHIEDIRREVYRMADEYQKECLMQIPDDANPMMAIGLNYIRFAAKEKLLFRLLFQTDSFQGQGLAQLMDSPELLPLLDVFQKEAGLTMEQTKQVFKALFLLVHGYASMLANNTMLYDEEEAEQMLNRVFVGMIDAIRREEAEK